MTVVTIENSECGCAPICVIGERMHTFDRLFSSRHHPVFDYLVNARADVYLTRE